VVTLYEVVPCSVATFGRELGGADDVGEQDCRQDTIEVGLLVFDARDETSNFGVERIGISYHVTCRSPDVREDRRNPSCHCLGFLRGWVPCEHQGRNVYGR
jgi:hypothetical protein